TSVKQPYYGIKTRGNPYTQPLFGRIGAPSLCVRLCGRRALKTLFGKKPGCDLTPISRQPNCSGFSSSTPIYTNKPAKANSLLAPSTVGLFGSLPMAPSMLPTSAMPRALCYSTYTLVAGTKNYSIYFLFQRKSCLKSIHLSIILAWRRHHFLIVPSLLLAWPAISKV